MRKMPMRFFWVLWVDLNGMILMQDLLLRKEFCVYAKALACMPTYDRFVFMTLGRFFGSGT